MKTSVVAALTAFSSLAVASPVNKRFDVSITFCSECGESYGMLFSTDRTNVEISTYTPSAVGRMSHLRSKPMVVHRITSPGGGFCTLVGVEGESAVIYSQEDKTLKTPPAMKWGNCGNN